MGSGQRWLVPGMGSHGVQGPRSKIRWRALPRHHQRVRTDRPTFTKVLRSWPRDFPLWRLKMKRRVGCGIVGLVQHC